MNKVISAAELALQIEDIASYDELKNPIIFASLVAIEFAKLHVEAALKIASEKGVTELRSEGNSDDQIVNKDSILNAYPLENIK